MVINEAKAKPPTMTVCVRTGRGVLATALVAALNPAPSIKPLEQELANVGNDASREAYFGCENFTLSW